MLRRDPAFDIELDLLPPLPAGLFSDVNDSIDFASSLEDIHRTDAPDIGRGRPSVNESFMTSHSFNWGNTITNIGPPRSEEEQINEGDDVMDFDLNIGFEEDDLMGDQQGDFGPIPELDENSESDNSEHNNNLATCPPLEKDQKVSKKRKESVRASMFDVPNVLEVRDYAQFRRRYLENINEAKQLKKMAIGVSKPIPFVTAATLLIDRPFHIAFFGDDQANVDDVPEFDYFTTVASVEVGRHNENRLSLLRSRSSSFNGDYPFTSTQQANNYKSSLGFNVEEVDEVLGLDQDENDVFDFEFGGNDPLDGELDYVLPPSSPSLGSSEMQNIQTELLEVLANTETGTDGTFCFQELFPIATVDKSEAIKRFYQVLVLATQNRIVVDQTSNGEIWLELKKT